MELRKDCELIEVEYQNEGKKAVMTFLDLDRGEVLEVNFNKQSWEDGKFIDDDKKAKQVEEWCEDYFDTDFKNLSKAIGVKRDVYHYTGFNSLWESEYPVKFDKGQVGEIVQGTIVNIRDDGKMILINYTDDGGILRQSKMTYSKYSDTRKQWFVDPVKKTKQYEKFNDKFGVPVEEADELVDKEILVEVRLAFGEHTYGDIKKPAWAKK